MSEVKDGEQPGVPPQPNPYAWSTLEELAEIHRKLQAEVRQRPELGPAVPELSLDAELVDFKPHFRGDVRGDKLTVTVPENLTRLIDVLIHTEGIPHRTRQDFARDAMYHYANLLQSLVNTKDQRITMILMREQINANALFLQEEHAKVSETLEAVHNYLVGLVDQGDVWELGPAVTNYWNLANEQVGHWRDLYLRAINGLAIVQAILDVLELQGVMTPWHEYRKVVGASGWSGSGPGTPADGGLGGDDGGGQDGGVRDAAGSGPGSDEGGDQERAEEGEAGHGRGTRKRRPRGHAEVGDPGLQPEPVTVRVYAGDGDVG